MVGLCRNCFRQCNLRLMKRMQAPLVKQGFVLLLASAWALATGWCVSTQNSAASPSAPSGPVSFLFTRSTAPVYDLTGSYQFDQQAVGAGGAPVTLSLGLAVQQDATGRLRGSGTTNVQVGDAVSSATYSVNGKISGGGGKATRVALSVRWTGQAAGSNAPFTITVQYNLEISQGVLNGTARGRAKFGKSGTDKISASLAAVPLPSGADGSWTLTLNLASSGGAGSIALPNGRSLHASLASSFSAHTGISRIKLAGTGGDRGNSLTLSMLPATAALDSVSGKLLGQTVTLKSLSGSVVSQAASLASLPSGSAGAQACLECHSPIQQTLNSTVHQQVGVQCENCHGPAANHAANDYDPTTRPVVDYAGTLCGTCHTGPQHPTYPEWQASAHATVVEDLNPPDRIDSCGRCHSGSVRVNLVEGTPLPVGNANVPLGCPTCHQPHQLTGDPVQLRNPLYSTNNYYLTTTSVFSNNYNPDINLCAQCHNDRGAAWTDSSEAPHRSLQYNMLLGTVGELDSGSAQYDPGSHGLLITNQCASCHMQSSPYVSAAQPAVTGHQMVVNSYGVCAQCHGSADNASNLVVFVSALFTNQIQTVQAELNQWATNNAPAILGTAEYGTRAWEYTTPGALSPGGPGPNAMQQALIPVNIQKARFNLYLVLYDGSLGVHNPLYGLSLLETAQNWVEQELSQ